MVTSPSGRSKVFPKEEDESEEEADGSSGNTSAAPTSRSRHNLVEQKYRHRLNAHFDQLLEVLPNTIGGISGQSTMSSPDFQSHDAGWSSAGFLPADRERKVSKAEVLDRARLYIQSLESNTRRLMADQEDLKARVEDYSRRNQEKHGKGGGK
ncbi:hypothetical protein QBC38DRAFT_361544 [Podospora fimiseda]|uniref:BHLH domain-containing protein n=1 Tax=Podospora fimiseda TaxID=252190 RepID=A0AAN7H1F2_9PEZI|nr:hypothetical protein QBC38DRAFT_361544 [Podospora fimiseda]